MTLFESNPQYREKATIWRIFSLLPFYAPFASGHMWRWFAINIPMELGKIKKFTSDIDILARVYDYPRSNEWFYKTWEVKVSLLRKDGTARSLKSGKTRKTMNQLCAYRDFGSPDVSLLDIFLCEEDFSKSNPFPPVSLQSSISTKLENLSKERFGYQLLPFEQVKLGSNEIPRHVLKNITNPMQTKVDILPASTSTPGKPFSRLVAQINRFFNWSRFFGANPFNQIVFCRDCRRLHSICMKDTHICPKCQSDLIAQS